jgi:hypothetical protein
MPTIAPEATAADRACGIAGRTKLSRGSGNGQSVGGAGSAVSTEPRRDEAITWLAGDSATVTDQSRGAIGTLVGIQKAVFSDMTYLLARMLRRLRRHVDNLTLRNPPHLAGNRCRSSV